MEQPSVHDAATPPAHQPSPCCHQRHSPPPPGSGAPLPTTKKSSDACQPHPTPPPTTTSPSMPQLTTSSRRQCTAPHKRLLCRGAQRSGRRRPPPAAAARRQRRPGRWRASGAWGQTPEGHSGGEGAGFGGAGGGGECVDSRHAAHACLLPSQALLLTPPAPCCQPRPSPHHPLPPPPPPPPLACRNSSTTASSAPAWPSGTATTSGRPTAQAPTPRCRRLPPTAAALCTARGCASCTAEQAEYWGRRVGTQWQAGRRQQRSRPSMLCVAPLGRASRRQHRAMKRPTAAHTFVSCSLWQVWHPPAWAPRAAAAPRHQSAPAPPPQRHPPPPCAWQSACGARAPRRPRRYQRRRGREAGGWPLRWGSSPAGRALWRGGEGGRWRRECMHCMGC